MKHFVKLFIALLLTLSVVHAKEFVIDSTHSHVGFSIKHMMISNVKGNFKTYSSEIDFDTEKKTLHNAKCQN